MKGKVYPSKINLLRLFSSVWALLALTLLSGPEVSGQCPQMDFNTQASGQCAPSTYTFTASGIPSGASIQWLSNGQPIGTGPITNYLFINPGNYTVSMVVTPNGGTPCPAVSKTITVLNQPQISIAYSPDPSHLFCGNAPMTIKALSSAGISQANWLVNSQNFFGDSISVVFQQPGMKIITLQIVDTNGCTAAIQDTINITMLSSVTGNYTVDPGDETGCAPHTMHVRANLNIPQGGAVDSIKWVFPNTSAPSIKLNGPISNGNIPLQSTTITQPGSHYMEMYAYVGNCAFKIDGNQDTIKVDGPANVMANIIQNNVDTLCTGEMMMIQNTTANMNDLMGEFRWLAPRAQPASGLGPIFATTFNDTGMFTITLRYISLCGDTTSWTKSVYAIGPIANFVYDSIEQHSCTAPYTAHFLTAPYLPPGSNTIKWYFYDLNDNIVDSSSALNPSYTYTQVGTYKVSLQITNTTTGCEHYIVNNRMIVVGEPMAVLSTDTIASKCVGQAVNLGQINQSQHQNGFTYTWKVFDGNSQLVTRRNGRNASYTFQNPGLYYVRLVIANGEACSDSATYIHPISVNGIVGKINTPPNQTCFTGDSLVHTFFLDSIQATPTGTNLSYQWSVQPAGQVTISDATAANPTFTFRRPHCYTVKLTVTTSQGCSKQFETQQFCIGAEADFDLPTTQLCTGGNMPLTNRSRIGRNNQSQYEWFTIPAGGTFSPSHQARAPSVSFAQPGTYQIGLVYTNSFNCVDTMIKTITVSDFSFSIYSPDTAVECGPSLIKVFADAPLATNFDWSISGFQVNNFKGNNGQNQIDSVSWFVSSGTYTISVVMTSPDGCQDSGSIVINIGGPRPRFFTNSATMGCSPLTVAFQDTSKFVDSLWFDFGDGSPQLTKSNYAYQGNFTHTYEYPYHNTTADSVVFEPTLVVASDDCPNPIILKQSVTVYPQPQIGFSAPVTSGCAPFDFTFADSSTHKGNNGFWHVLDYGDGQRDSNQTGQFNHQYTQPGLYSLHYRVYTKFGCVNDTLIPQYVDVFALPVADFATTPREGCFVGNNFAFQNQSALPQGAQVQSVVWYFGDGDTSQAFEPTHSYAQPGIYEVSMVITSTQGCTDSIFKSQWINVWDTVPVDNNGMVVASVENGSVEIGWNRSHSEKFAGYRIERGNNVIFQTGIITQDQYTDNASPANFQPVRYTLWVKDSCDQNWTAAAHHRTVHLSATSMAEATVSLSWTAYEGWDNLSGYTVQYHEGDHNWSNYSQVPATQLSLEVENLCNKNYFFRIVANNGAQHNLTAKSNVAEITPQFTLPSQLSEVFEVHVTEQNHILINIEESPEPRFEKYIIERSVDGGTYDPAYDQTTQLQYVDTRVDVHHHTYAYRVRIADECENETQPGNYGTSILLSAQTDEENGIVLEWTPYLNWDLGVMEYQIFRSENNGQYQYIGSTDGQNTTYTDAAAPANGDGSLSYYVEAICGNALFSSTSNRTVATFPVKLFIPDAFSPNGDGLNDVFTLTGISFREFDFVVFDRWGNQVYSEKSTQIAWDGTGPGGNILPQGVYVYKLIARDSKDRYVSREGTITLMR